MTRPPAALRQSSVVAMVERFPASTTGQLATRLAMGRDSVADYLRQLERQGVLVSTLETPAEARERVLTQPRSILAGTKARRQLRWSLALADARGVA